VLDALQASLGLRVCDAPFEAVICEAKAHKWTLDPCDRIIVAQAALHEAPLITKDAALAALHESYARAVW
jgi:PIN domain nuclease of toxin-antitoxin system